MLVSLANIILRQARKEQNPRAYLDAFISSRFAEVSTQGGVITATSVNGKSVQLQIPAGTSARDMMTAGEMALATLEQGLPRVPRSTVALIR